MAASYPIIVSRQSELEKKSLLAISDCLEPWRVTWVDQRDDFGRDGFIQVVDEDGDRLVISPLMATIQAKGHGAPFEVNHKEQLESRHLALWADDSSWPMIVVVWSKADCVLRWRTARDIVNELDSRNPGWRQVKEPTVEFRTEHATGDPVAIREEMRRRVADESDRFGGIDRFHRSIRRVVLNHIYSGTTVTSQTIELSRPGRSLRLITGPAWRDGDLDTRDVDAARILVTSLMLFEEVWLPLHFASVAGRTLGSEILTRLIEQRRLILFDLASNLAFVHGIGEAFGEPAAWAWPEERERRAERISGHARAIASPGIDKIIERNLRVVPADVATIALKETLHDLQNARIRALMGFRPHVRTQEAAWDAPLVNRLLAVNESRSVAKWMKSDVVNYEGGLSRIASEKDFSLLRFSRTYPTSDAFDGVLRRTGTPDVGNLAATIGVDKCVEIADSAAGADFRNWFWESAAALIGSGADMRTTMESHLGETVGQDIRSLRLPLDLKLRFYQQRGAEYIVGAPVSGESHGYSTRSDMGSAVLQKQAQRHRKQRIAAIAQFVKHEIGPYDPCPCASREKFRFCCGR